MKLKRILPGLLLSVLLLVQTPLAVLATDGDAPADGSTPVETTATPTPTPDPTPTPTESPAPELPAKPSYAFNDSAQHWEATDQDSFSWDAGLDRWTSPLYWFDPQVAWYHVNKSVAPAAPTDPVASGTPGSGQAGPLASASANDPANSNTGPGSINNSSLNNSNDLLANISNIASVTNLMTSLALTGAANVAMNTNGGSATTGAATVAANFLNLLNSMWSWGSGGISTFMYNIFGDHTGDINLVVPGVIGGGGVLGGMGCGGVDSNSNTGPLSVNNATTNCNNKLTGNNNTTGAITNNIDLSSQTGDANVQNNTTGGDAVSGDATTALNIINMINSSIGAGQMFFGMINIFGNLNGDILFPGLSLDDAIAGSPSGSQVSNSNTGAGSTNNANANNNNSANLNNSASAAFNNNIDASATSGAANVQNNTNGGSATTGNADTNTNTFNLFDTSVFGDNAVLVLINDMGHWVGRIMNLPGGSSGGALLTSNATVTNNNTGAGSTNNASSNNNNSADLNNTSSGTITNNVKAGATSGDANVENNTNGGNAISGAAKVATNIANIAGSHISVGKVFGILIVNVFGSWTGSVGVDTDAGNAPGAVAPLSAAVTPTTSMTILAQLAGANTSNAGGGAAAGSGGAGQAANSQATNTSIGVKTLAAQNSYHDAARKAQSSWPILLVIFSIASMALAGGLTGLEKKLAKKT